MCNTHTSSRHSSASLPHTYTTQQSRSDSHCSKDSIDYDIDDLEAYPNSQEEGVIQSHSNEECGAEKSLHSSSAEGERTRLRDREEGAVPSMETDALKILGLVSYNYVRLLRVMIYLTIYPYIVPTYL